MDPHHPDIINCKFDYACLKFRKQEYKEAESLF